MWIKIILIGIQIFFLLPFIIVLLWNFIAFIYAAALKLHRFLKDKIEIFSIDKNPEEEKELTVDVSKLPMTKAMLTNQYLTKIDTSFMNSELKSKIIVKCTSCGNDRYFSISPDKTDIICSWCGEKFNFTNVNTSHI